jgi:hypothetical protein
MSKLENYIHENRELFDLDEPNPEHFKRFELKLEFEEKHKIRFSKKLLKYASVFALVISVSAVVKFGFLTNKKTADRISNNAQINSEFYETENYYQKNYENGLAELNKMSCKSSDNQKIMVLKDIDDLNESYEELKSELKKNPMDSRIKNAMINNYENKIKLLDLVITELKKNC